MKELDEVARGGTGLGEGRTSNNKSHRSAGQHQGSVSKQNAEITQKQRRRLSLLMNTEEEDPPVPRYRRTRNSERASQEEV